MPRLLHVIGSPRGALSRSGLVATAWLDALRVHRPDIAVDTLDPWREELPPLDAAAVAAKMAVTRGGTPDPAQRAAWDAVLAVVERFRAADRYLFTVPMWNGGIPYRVKHYIDLIMQPGLLFTLDRATGYAGLLRNKRATVIYSAGIHAPGLPPAFGADYHATYFDWWLRETGVAEIDTIRLPPTGPGPDLEPVLARAREMAGR